MLPENVFQSLDHLVGHLRGRDGFGLLLISAAVPSIALLLVLIRARCGLLDDGVEDGALPRLFCRGLIRA